MKNYMRTLRIITALFAVITAFMLAFWSLGITDSDATKDTLVKVASLSGIAAALSAVLMLLSGNDKQR